MASTQSVIELIFNGIDNASQTANSVGKSLNDLNKSVSDVTQPFEDLADKLAIAQAALLAIAGVIGGLAYNESVKFQASLLDLQKQLDDGEGQARDYADAINQIALKYGENSNQVATASAEFKAAGFSISESLTLIQRSLDLSIAGGVSFDQAVKIINSSLAGFQIANENAIEVSSRFADVINKAADLTKSDFEQLAQGFADLSPVAKLAGLSFEDTAAILSKITDIFGSGSEAAVSLRSTFASLRNPTEDAADAMLKLGVAFNSAGEPIGSIKEIINTIVPNFIKLTKEQQSSTAATLFGKEQYDKMIPILTQWNQTMELSAKITNEAGGSIEKEVNLRLQSAQQVIKTTNESFRQLLTSLGDKIQVDTTGVIASLGGLALAFKNVIDSGQLDQLFATLGPQLKEIETFFKEFAKNLPAALNNVDFSGLTRSIENLSASVKSAFKALFGEIDVSTPDKLAESIQRVVDVIRGLINVTSGEIRGLEFYLDKINKLATAFKDATPEAQGFIGELIGLGAGLNKISSVIDTALLSFIAFGSKVPAALAAVKSESLLLAAGLTSPVGIAVELGVAAGSIATFLGWGNKLADYTWPDWLAGYEGATAGTAVSDIADGFAALSNDIKSFLGLTEEVNNKSLAPQKIPVGTYDNALTQIRLYEEEIAKTRKSTEDLENFMSRTVPIDSWDGVLAKLNKIDEATLNIVDSNKKFIGSYEDLPELKLPDNVKVGEYTTNISGAVAINQALVKSYSSLPGVTVKATGAFAAVSTAAADQAKKVDEATKKSQEFQAKMEEIASNERIKTIEAYVNLNVADLEAQADRVKATFDSINTTVNSTGDLLGSLFGSLASADTYTQLRIIEQIEAENKRRDAALELQRKVTEAEIENIKAKTRALDRGDSLIKIDGTGLAPQLEAFMWEILKSIRVRANADFADYLLGVT